VDKRPTTRELDDDADDDVDDFDAVVVAAAASSSSSTTSTDEADDKDDELVDEDEAALEDDAGDEGTGAWLHNRHAHAATTSASDAWPSTAVSDVMFRNTSSYDISLATRGQSARTCA
jgi:hypothetical protein